MHYVINNYKELYEFFIYTIVILCGIVVVYNLYPSSTGMRVSEFLATTNIKEYKVGIAPTLFCGDGSCQAYLGENVLTCPQDCFLP
jgi:hypothetical protein